MACTDPALYDSEADESKRRDSFLDEDDDEQKATTTKPVEAQQPTQRSTLLDIAACLREQTATDDDVDDDDAATTPVTPTMTTATSRHPRMSQRGTTAAHPSQQQRRRPWMTSYDLIALRQDLLNPARLSENLKHERPYLTDISHLSHQLSALAPLDRGHAAMLLRLETCRQDLAAFRRRNQQAGVMDA